MPEKTLDLEHGIIFICDPATSPLQIPDYEPASPVSRSSNCIAVIGRHLVDGSTTIAIESQVSAPLAHLVFEGQLPAPSRRMTVSTAGDSNVLSIAVMSRIGSLRVWLDDLQYPERILIEAK